VRPALERILVLVDVDGDALRIQHTGVLTLLLAGRIEVVLGAECVRVVLSYRLRNAICICMDMLYYLTDNNAVRLQRECKCNKQQHNIYISRSLPTTNEIYCHSLAGPQRVLLTNEIKNKSNQEREKLSVRTST